MKIYFSGAIKGGRKHESTFLEIVTYLEHCGHHVLSIHVARADLWAEYAMKSAMPYSTPNQPCAFISRERTYH